LLVCFPYHCDDAARRLLSEKVCNVACSLLSFICSSLLPITHFVCFIQAYAVVCDELHDAVAAVAAEAEATAAAVAATAAAEQCANAATAAAVASALETKAVKTASAAAVATIEHEMAAERGRCKLRF
jgi:hypothetical protein